MPLKEKFGKRVTYDEIERRLYAHDLASLPGVVDRLVRRLPEAVVQPSNTEELVFLVKHAREKGTPLVPRGAGTSGYGGAIPYKGGIVVDLSHMRRVLEIHEGKLEVEVEPGVIWEQLDRELAKKGLALRAYPSSAPGSTVGGWLANGGSGIGSYQFGWAGENVSEIKLVTGDEKVLVLKGDDLHLALGAEGTTGFIASAKLKLQKRAEEVPVLFAFGERRKFFSFLRSVVDQKLALWHVAFFSPEYVALMQRASGHAPLPEGKYLVLAVYRKESTKEVEEALDGLAGNSRGEKLKPELALQEWNERFYPMRLKRLGPSLIPFEGIVRLERLEEVASELSKGIPDVALEGSLVKGGDAILLGYLLSDERKKSYTFDFTRSLQMMRIAESFGGRPYGIGLYFTNRAHKRWDKKKLARIKDFQHSHDPKRILNPGKLLPEETSLSRSGVLLGASRLSGISSSLTGALSRLAHYLPRTAQKLERGTDQEAFTCAQCGYCREVCTLYSARGWESSSPRGKWYLLQEYTKGRCELTQEMVKTFLLCTTCKRCDDVCQVRIPIEAEWGKLRGELIQKKGFGTIPAFEMMAASFHSQNNIWADEIKERDAWFPKDLTYSDSGEVGYWAGCTASFLETNIAENAVRILAEGGVDFAYLGKDEACCGIPFLVSGQWDVWQDAVRHNIQEINRRGIKKLVISCPGCWVSLAHHYKEWAPKLGLAWDVEPIHITEITRDLIRQNKLNFKKEVRLKATYHDPCHIGRHGGIYDAPREVICAIPGVQFEEMEHNRENSLCCGSVLTRIGESETSDKIADARIKEAEAIGADAILTTCPCCEFQLRVGGKSVGSSTNIKELTDVVVEALGYPTKNPEEKVHHMWGVFDDMIEVMTPAGMAEMMKEMLPSMVSMMPGYMISMMKALKKMPALVQDAALRMMGALMPVMMPMMMGDMMPKMMPLAQTLIKKRVPEMPEAMERLMPEMLPEVMSALMPRFLPEILKRIKPEMLEAFRAELRSGKPIDLPTET
jgi:Fe-S oxidoreductase/FAD/FMN-containing dehydrogenase